MLIIPSLYIEKGRTVSLYKGEENEQKTVYNKSPLNVAKSFEKQGASLIHIIDIDASRGQGSNNLDLIKKIVNELKIPIEIGGGIRTLANIEALFSVGVKRVVLGVSAEPILEKALKKYGPDRIVLGIKARKSFVESDNLPPDSDEVLEVAEKALAKGVRYMVYKDLEREGTLFHPNYDEIERLLFFLGGKAKIFSSGGVTTLEDLSILRNLGATGVLVSRALLEYKIDLKEAIRYCETPEDKLFALALGNP
jgi:phosphoribosylformimino-5-aminoimidazole carboxamide ribotide isomerase